ncbi:hypothetical protein SARC_11237 [Sphaeroforma arctica JP610]|uniref:Uncharacterized protein n=1 Tax=Sphaeroforma arctica JP610 TaxID=667725 RepID=A0A0L0FJP9_9EUKA|nr:hypothetical protein SARC_11237 [Sphaeroforma arctica JP610]KNC76253.1 hypothetical protein SARC_11237 [Sphaeroforma arctica JP610]|eukprot:XP_014150155.1 hypothetical protein SARC_11237 [Sphaeroforma arctica JP610]
MAELLPQFTVEAPGVPGQDRLVVRPETTHQGRTYTKPTLQAFLHLRKFNDLCVSIQTEGGPDGTMPVVSFSPRFMSLFRGVVDGFLDWIKVEVDIWVQQAIVNDNFNPTSEDELHSTSCTDVFWSLSEVLTFLQGIQMGDKAHWSQSMETYVMVLCASVRHYISEISKIARHESLRLEEKAGAYMPSDVACTLINDFVMSARYLQIISGNLNIRTSALNEILDDAPLDPDEVNSGPDNFKSTGNSKANSFGLPGDQTRPSALDRQTSTISTTSAAQSLMHREMNQTSRMVALCLVGNIRMMGSRIVKPIRQIIQHIINKDSFFSSVKNLFSFGSSSGSTPDLSKSDGMIMVRTSSLPWQRKATTSTPLSAEVAEDMAPTLAYFDDVMSCAATRLYPHAVYLILEEMWVQVLQCAEDVLEAGDAKSELSLARLGESVMQLWEFFHADGQGLGIEVVQRPRIKTIQQVIQLLRAKDMEGLISMHSLFVRDAAARAFVSKTMKATGDRSVLDYLKSTGD